MEHELTVAANAGNWVAWMPTVVIPLLVGIPISSPPDLYLTTQVMLVVLGMGGFTTGGLNFDASVAGNPMSPSI